MRKLFAVLALVLGLVGLASASAAAAPAHYVTGTQFVLVSEIHQGMWQPEGVVSISQWHIAGNRAWRTFVLRDYTNGNSACGGGYFCGWEDADYYGNRGYWSTGWIGSLSCMNLNNYGINNVISSFNNATGFFIRTWNSSTCDTPLTGGTHDWVWGRGASHWVGSTYNDLASSQYVT